MKTQIRQEGKPRPVREASDTVPPLPVTLKHQRNSKKPGWNSLSGWEPHFRGAQQAGRHSVWSRAHMQISWASNPGKQSSRDTSTLVAVPSACLESSSGREALEALRSQLCLQKTEDSPCSSLRLSLFLASLMKARCSLSLTSNIEPTGKGHGTDPW